MLFTPATRPRARPAFSAGLDSGRPAPPSRAEGGQRPLFALAAQDLGAPPAARDAPPAAEAPADAVLATQFAAALEDWFLRQQTPPTPSHFLPLLEQYEALAAAGLERAEAALRAHDAGHGAVASREAVRSECDLLRGERLSWRLLIDLYYDYDARQAPPPSFPAAADDWAGSLRRLGDTPPPATAERPWGLAGGTGGLGSASGGGVDLAGRAAAAGLHTYSLHDEAVEEEAMRLADPLLDLASRTLGWLQASSRPPTRPLPQNVSHRSTAFRIAMADSPDALPSSLDPDAPAREKKRLDPEDEFEQAEMLRSLWHFIRSGQVLQAQQFCRDCHQWWRAASLGGGEPWRYDEEGRAWVGNPNRPLWRMACKAIADRALSSPSDSSRHEAALYAALSGSPDLLPRAVLPVCTGWEDGLWARLAAGVGWHVAEQQRRRREEGRQAEPMTMQALRQSLLLSADCRGDSPAALAHAALQSGLLLFRALLLPKPAAAAALAWQDTSGDTSRDGKDTSRDASAVDAQLHSLLLLSLSPPPPSAAAAPAALDRLRRAATGQAPDPPPPEPPPGTPSPPPGRLRCHTLRFGTHLSLFLHAVLGYFGMPALQPRTEATMRRLRAEYVELLGSVAAAAVRDPAPAGAANAGRPDLTGGGASPLGPCLSEAAAAVALMAQTLQPDEALVAGMAGFLCRLPHDLTEQQMRLCFEQAARLFPPDQLPLLPHIALRVCTHRQSLPLPPPTQPAALAAATRAHLACVRWLLLAPAEPQDTAGGGPPAWAVVQALAQALLFTRRAAAAAAGPPGGPLPVSDGLFGAPLPVLDDLLQLSWKAATEIDISHLQTELEFWVLFFRATSALSAHRTHRASRPSTKPPHPNPPRQPAGEEAPRHGGREEAVWLSGLVACANEAHAAARRALTVKEGGMGALPAVEQVHTALAVASSLDVSPAVASMHIDPPGASLARSRPSLLSLRARLLPPLIEELHHILLDTSRLAADPDLAAHSLNLADLIADDRYRLYAYFGKGGMLRMLGGFRASALAILAGGEAAGGGA